MGQSDLNDILEAGQTGEKIIRQYLKSISVDAIFQADWIVKYEGEYRLIEAKHQEVFTPPPFYGHGLPKWQIDARLNFYHSTRIVPYLFVVEKSDYQSKEGHALIWHQSLIVLEISNYIDSRGNKPRRIYDIAGFKKTYFPIH